MNDSERAKQLGLQEMQSHVSCSLMIDNHGVAKEIFKILEAHARPLHKGKLTGWGFVNIREETFEEALAPLLTLERETARLRIKNLMDSFGSTPFQVPVIIHSLVSVQNQILAEETAKVFGTEKSDHKAMGARVTATQKDIVKTPVPPHVRYLLSELAKRPELENTDIAYARARTAETDEDTLNFVDEWAKETEKMACMLFQGIQPQLHIPTGLDTTTGSGPALSPQDLQDFREFLQYASMVSHTIGGSLIDMMKAYGRSPTDSLLVRTANDVAYSVFEAAFLHFLYRRFPGTMREDLNRADYAKAMSVMSAVKTELETRSKELKNALDAEGCSNDTRNLLGVAHHSISHMEYVMRNFNTTRGLSVIMSDELPQILSSDVPHPSAPAHALPPFNMTFIQGEPDACMVRSMHFDAAHGSVSRRIHTSIEAKSPKTPMVHTSLWRHHPQGELCLSSSSYIPLVQSLPDGNPLRKKLLAHNETTKYQSAACMMELERLGILEQMRLHALTMDDVQLIDKEMTGMLFMRKQDAVQMTLPAGMSFLPVESGMQDYFLAYKIILPKDAVALILWDRDDGDDTAEDPEPSPAPYEDVRRERTKARGTQVVHS